MASGKRKISIIVFAAALAAVTAFAAVLIGVTRNYADVYGLKELRGGVIDVTDFDQSEHVVYNSLVGEWEFFYNQWIVTDGQSGEKNGNITLPGSWTGKKEDGKPLPAEGYASFRIRVDGMKEGEGVSLLFSNYPYALRVFVNGKPAGFSGTMSKEADGTFCTGRLSERRSYAATDGEPMEIVVELSATRDGGFYGMFWLRLDHLKTEYNNFLSLVSRIALGIVFAYVVFGAVMCFAFRGKENQAMSLILIVFVFLHFLVSKEAWGKISPFFPSLSYTPVFQMQVVSGMFLLLAFALQLVSKKLVKLSKSGFIFIAASCVTGAALYYLLQGTGLRILSAVFPAAGFIYLLYLLSRACAVNMKDAVIHVLMLCFLFGLFVGESLDNFGFLAFGMESITSLILLLFIIPFTLSGLFRIKDSAREAQKAAELQLEVNTVKQQSLRAQIKPHFIFNALTAVESLYRKDLKEGEEAMEKFARHLRLNVDAHNKEFVPFSEELDNILNYFELENIRLENKLTLLLDTAYTDFEVPILSLQPLIENAVKHAATHEKEDGYIQIGSRLEDGRVVVEVADNGKGFDTGKIREGAAGLKNVCERLKYAAGAHVAIASEPGKGTTVNIVFPKKELLI